MSKANRYPRQLWTPDSNAGLTLWLDAMALGTLTLSSGAVSAWADRSPANHGVAQGTSGARPAWSAAAGGTALPGVTFDGTDDVLTHPAAWLYAAGAATVAIVATYASPSTGRHAISEGSTASNTPVYSLLRTNPSTAASATTQLVNDANTTLLANTPAGGSSWQSLPQVLLRVDTGSNVAAYRNGTLGNNASYARSATTLDTFALGAQARATPTNFFGGTIHEVVAWSRALEAREIDQVNGYLAWKWAQQSQLPSGFPWLSQAP